MKARGRVSEGERMKKFASTLVWAALVMALNAVPQNLSVVWAQDTGRVKELFGDPNFERGFRATDICRSPFFLGDLKLPFQGEATSDKKPVWGLATHASRYNIADAEVVADAKSATAETPGQIVSRSKDDHGVATLKLGVRTENEYEAPRKADQMWIHLLLTRDFSSKERVAFRDVDSVVFSCDAKVSNVAKTDPDHPYNPALHATQASFYFVFSNANADSRDFRDYVWFGISFFDDRYEVQTDYVEVDGDADPNKIGTGKLIYRIGERRTIDECMGGVNPYSQEWTHIETDLKRYLSDALEAARKKDFLLDSKPDDFVIAHFNFGWETPGTYRSDLEIKNLRLLAKFKGESEPSTP